MTVAEELRKHADLAIKEGGMYYSGSYLDALAKRAESEQSVAAKLRELVKDMHTMATDYGVYVRYPYCDAWDEKLAVVEKQMRELGVDA